MIAANAISIPSGLLNVAVAVVMRWMMATVVMMIAVRMNVIVVGIVMMIMMSSTGTTNCSVANVQYMRLSFQIIWYCVLL